MPSDSPTTIPATCRALAALLAALQAEAARRRGVDAAEVRDHLRAAHVSLRRALEVMARAALVRQG